MDSSKYRVRRATLDDISALMDKLGISRYSVVGHDIGMWIAYSLAAKHGAQVDKLVASEALIPGISPTPPMLQPPEKNAGLAVIGHPSQCHTRSRVGWIRPYHEYQRPLHDTYWPRRA